MLRSEEISNIFNDNYDKGFRAGEIQATFDRHSTWINIRVLDFSFAPHSLREMGFNDGYAGFLRK
jgi:hypothetical protein